MRKQDLYNYKLYNKHLYKYANNLISLADRPKEQRTQIARLGAIATNKIKKRRKAWRLCYQHLLIVDELKNYVAVLEKKYNTAEYIDLIKQDEYRKLSSLVRKVKKKKQQYLTADASYKNYNAN